MFGNPTQKIIICFVEWLVEMKNQKEHKARDLLRTTSKHVSTALLPEASND
jgi:hypothetical protein